MKSCQLALAILLPCMVMHIAGFPEGNSEPASMGRKTIQHRVEPSSVNTVPKVADGASEDSTEHFQELRMPGAHPAYEDSYLCSSFKLPENKEYITHFEPIASADRTHHMIIYGCDQAFNSNPGQYWKCGALCARSSPKILYAWAKNAPPTTLPPDVGFKVGQGTEIKYLVLQIHYTLPIPDNQPGDNSGTKVTLTSKEQKYIAGIYLLLKYGLNIPPQTKDIHGDISCRYDGTTVLHPFAFRVHAHSLSTVISGYHYNDSYHLLGKGNPQWPQAFYPMNDHVPIKPGDYLGSTHKYSSNVCGALLFRVYMAARCTFDSTGRDRGTRIGGTHNDEMCNFYMMYYTNAATGEPFFECGGMAYPWLTEGLPSDSSIPLPSNPALDMVAHSHSHGSQPGNGYDSRFTGTYNRLAPEQRDSDYGLGSSWVDENPYDYYDNDNDKPNIQDYSYYEVQNQRNRNRHPYRGSYQQQDPQRQQQHSGAFFPALSDQLSDRDQYRGSSYGNPAYARPSHPNGAKEHIMLKPGISKPTNNGIRVGGGKAGGGGAGGSGGGRRKVGPALVGQNGVVTRQGNGNHGNRSAPAKAPNKAKPTGSSAPGQTAKAKAGVSSKGGSLIAVPEWPSNEGNSLPTLGQVGGLDTDSKGNLHVFHRAGRTWDLNSFNVKNQFNQIGDGEIKEATIAVFSPAGKVIEQWGQGMFFLPHGIHVDHEDNIWVTDVATHQVIKFMAGTKKPALTLGQHLDPGSDNEHFCKPADVATLSTGEFFVADGYCNHRIMKFDVDGKFISQWGTKSMNVGADGFPPPGALDIPHSLAILEEKSWVCVADRENGRIQCFNYDGTFVKQLHPTEFHGRLFALAYLKKNGLLYAVNGPDVYGRNYPVAGFVLDPQMGALLETFSPPDGFQQPHTIAVSQDGSALYIGQIEATTKHKIWKFEISAPGEIGHQSVKKGGVVVRPETSDSGNVKMEVDDEQIEKKAEEDEASDLTVSMIIGSLLVVPIVVIVLVTVFMRMRRRGMCNLPGSKNRNRRFNLGNFFNRHKGFDRLNTEESDHELDHLNSDSDVEEYSATTRKA